MIVELYAKTDVGMVREGNEDNLLVLDLTAGRTWIGTEGDKMPDELQTINLGDNGMVLVVSDGMGGALAGEVASRMAVETVRDMMLGGDSAAGSGYDSRSSLGDVLRRATQEANLTIHTKGHQEPNLYQGMGATLTGAAVRSDLLDLVQVGDSRAYLLRGENIKQATKDQSLVQQLVDVGQITEDEAESHMFKNVILQALGAQPELQPVSGRVRIKRGDILLLCSDGLSGKLKIGDIKEILGTLNNDLGGACKRLIDLANERGGEDNITVIVARFLGEDLPAGDGDVIGVEPLSTHQQDDDTTLGDSELPTEVPNIA